jgi:hypothetical protein
MYLVKNCHRRLQASPVTATDSPEGAPYPQNSVETGGEAPPDWSRVQEVYQREGTIHGVARHYGVRFATAKAEMLNPGIALVSPSERINQIDWSSLREDGRFNRSAQRLGESRGFSMS